MLTKRYMIGQDRIFRRAETFIYAAVIVLLFGGATHLLLEISLEVSHSMWRLTRGETGLPFVPILDRLLLVLMLVEIMHTVRTSIRNHTLTLEPFLVIGLIAGVRRVLVITAEASAGPADPTHLLAVILELALIAALSAIFLWGLHMLRKGRPNVGFPGPTNTE